MILKLLTENKNKIAVSVPISVLILWCVKLDLLPEYLGGSKTDNLIASINKNQLGDVLLLVSLIFVFAVFLITIKKIKKAYYAPSIIIGSVFAVMMSAGKAFRYNSSLNILFSGTVQVLKFALRSAGFFILFTVSILLIFEFLDSRSPTFFKNAEPDKLSAYVREHSIILYLIILGITAVFYLVFMPGFLMGDTASQIFESFGVEAYYFPSKFPFTFSDSVLTNMHPFVSTFYVYGCMMIGKMILGSYNLGIYIAVIMQFAFLEFVIVRSCKVLAQIGLKGIFILGYLVYIFINVIMVNYLFVLTKDVIYTAFLFLFAIELYLLLSGSFRTIDYFIIALSAIGTAAFRGEGIFCITIMLAFAFIYLLLKKYDLHKIIFSAALFICLIAIHLIWSNAVLPALHVSPAVKSIQMSIPLQQIGRYVTSGKKLTEEEYDSISAVMDIEQIKSQYDPENGDSLKNIFNHGCSESELKAFIGAWTKICIKDPGCAFRAWLNNKYEYFYLEETFIDPYSLSWSQRMMNDVNEKTMDAVGIDLDIHYPKSDVLNTVRVKAEAYLCAFKDLPLINILILPGIYVLMQMIFTVYMFVNKCGRGKILLIVVWFTLIFTNMLSAVNASYGRYLYPIMLMLPFVFFAGIKKEVYHNK